MNSIEAISDYLVKNNESISRILIENILKQLNINISKEEELEAFNAYRDFFCYLGKAILEKEDLDISEELTRWSKKNGRRQAAAHEELSELISRYAKTRLAFIETIAGIMDNFDLPSNERTLIHKRINYIFDLSITETIRSFEKLTDEILKKTRDDLKELSTPVVPIQDGIAVIPFIGIFDEERTRHVEEYVVPKVKEMKIKLLIADFSGMGSIDAQVGFRLSSVYDIFKLLGVPVVVTGILPEVAKALVNAGIDLQRITFYPTVMNAINAVNKVNK